MKQEVSYEKRIKTLSEINRQYAGGWVHSLAGKFSRMWKKFTQRYKRNAGRA